MQRHKPQLAATHRHCLGAISTARGRWLIQKLLTVLMETALTVRPYTDSVCCHGVCPKIYFVEIIVVKPQSSEKSQQVFFAGLHILVQRTHLETIKDYYLHLNHPTF